MTANQGEDNEATTIQIDTAPVVEATLDITAERIAGARTVQPDAIAVEAIAPRDSAEGLIPKSISEAVRETPFIKEFEPVQLPVSRPTWTQQAGLSLTYIVLALLGAAIAGLIISVIWIEDHNFAPYSNITQGILNYLATRDEASAALSARRAAAAAILRAGREQARATMPDTDLMPVVEFVHDLGASGRLPPEKITSLEACITRLRHPPAGASPVTLSDHQAAIDACLNVLDSIEINTIAQGLDLDRLRLMREIGKRCA